MKHFCAGTTDDEVLTDVAVDGVANDSMYDSLPKANACFSLLRKQSIIQRRSRIIANQPLISPKSHFDNPLLARDYGALVTSAFDLDNNCSSSLFM